MVWTGEDVVIPLDSIYPGFLQVFSITGQTNAPFFLKANVKETVGWTNGPRAAVCLLPTGEGLFDLGTRSSYGFCELIPLFVTLRQEFGSSLLTPQ